jgi:XTP/dITP diphosphohydrolase
MQELIFASNNDHKIRELQASIGNLVKITSLKAAGIVREIEEPFETIRENASEKSRIILELSEKDCFSEDTGLEVDALNGEPGVHSARYAGEERSDRANIEKLLTKLQDAESRRARFRTVISLRLNGAEHIFEGLAEGSIVNEPVGDKGFGYDPVFLPLGSSQTFAQMDINQKAQYSHRRKAGDKLVAYLYSKLDLPIHEKLKVLP